MYAKLIVALCAVSMGHAGIILTSRTAYSAPVSSGSNTYSMYAAQASPLTYATAPAAVAPVAYAAKNYAAPVSSFLTLNPHDSPVAHSAPEAPAPIVTKTNTPAVSSHSSRTAYAAPAVANYAAAPAISTYAAAPAISAYAAPAISTYAAPAISAYPAKIRAAPLLKSGLAYSAAPAVSNLYRRFAGQFGW